MPHQTRDPENVPRGTLCDEAWEADGRRVPPPETRQELVSRIIEMGEDLDRTADLSPADLFSSMMQFMESFATAGDLTAYLNQHKVRARKGAANEYAHIVKHLSSPSTPKQTRHRRAKVFWALMHLSIRSEDVAAEFAKVEHLKGPPVRGMTRLSIIYDAAHAKAKGAGEEPNEAEVAEDNGAAELGAADEIGRELTEEEEEQIALRYIEQRIRSGRFDLEPLGYATRKHIPIVEVRVEGGHLIASVPPRALRKYLPPGVVDQIRGKAHRAPAPPLHH